MALTNKKVAKVKYDFAVDGGANAADITLAVNETIPAGAVVTGVEFFADTAASGSSSTLLIKCGTQALTTAEAEASFALNTFGAFTLAADTKINANGEILLDIGTADLTAGVIDIFVEYIY